MGVSIKRVLLKSNSYQDTGITLCMSSKEYYINYFSPKGVETLIDDIKTKEEAQVKFLDLVWEMS